MAIREPCFTIMHFEQSLICVSGICLATLPQFTTNNLSPRASTLEPYQKNSLEGCTFEMEGIP